MVALWSRAWEVATQLKRDPTEVFFDSTAARSIVATVLTTDTAEEYISALPVDKDLIVTDPAVFDALIPPSYRELV